MPSIFSPDVVFFRDGRFHLLKEPVEASVLKLPAVNMGQVILKGEDEAEAEQAMKRRMKLALAIFAFRGCRNLILGAYVAACSAMIRLRWLAGGRSFWGSIFPVSLIPLYMRFWTVPARDSSHNSRKAEEEQYLLTFKMSRSILVPTMKRGAGVESG